jgi:hypothetical protein
LQATHQADFSDEQAQAAYNHLMEEIDLQEKTSSENNNSVDEDEQITKQIRNSSLRGGYGLFPPSSPVDNSMTEQEAAKKTQEHDNSSNTLTWIFFK